MLNLIISLLVTIVLLAVIVVPLNGAAHYEVFGRWPDTWKDWLDFG